MAEVQTVKTGATTSYNGLCGIYAITNKENDKVYIGSSADISQRWRMHKYQLRKGKHHNQHLQHAFNRYGEYCFNLDVVETCKEDILFEREEVWMKHYKSRHIDYGYNIYKGDRRNGTGYRHDDVALKKISDSMLGNQHAKGNILNESTRKKMSDSRLGNQNARGKKWTKEAKQRLSESRKGKSRKPFSIYTRKKMSESARKRYQQNPPLRDALGKIIN